MKKLVVFIMSSLILNFIGLGQSNTNSQSFHSISEKADALIEECIYYKEMVGVAAGISKDGKVEWKGSAGSMDMKNNIAANNDMIHRTASIAKPMTAVAVMQLYEQGKLSLKDEIQKYLPYFPKKEEGAITIEQLLNHSSGIAAYQSDSEAFSTKSYKNLEVAISVFKNRPLISTPGFEYHYTTYGYVVLGAIIEKASGLSFRNYMKENVWNKADMRNTDVEIFGEKYTNKTKLYKKTKNGFESDTQTDLSVKVPGGGFQTTVDDLLKFGNAILSNKLIKKETLAMMIENGGLKEHGNPYGFGWFLYGKSSDRFGRIIGHSGSQSGTATQLMIYLDKQMVIAALSNTSGSWNDVVGFTDKLDNVVLDNEEMKQPLNIPVEISQIKFQDYFGKYELSADRIAEVYQDGEHLMSFVEGLGFSKLHALGEDRFFIRQPQIEVLFERENKKVIRVVLKENGETTKHKRLSYELSKRYEFYNKIKTVGFDKAKEWVLDMPESKFELLKSKDINSVAYDLLSDGEIEKALEVLKLNLSIFPDEKPLDEEVINSLGYQLLSSNRIKRSIEFFELNVLAFPDSYNAHDSLGEAYLVNAKESYRKSIELNPENTNGAKILELLEYE